MECWCCGVERDASELTALHHRDEVVICTTCVGALSQRAGLLDVTPILPVADMTAAVSFYEAAGFSVRQYEHGGYGFVQHGDRGMFDLTLDTTSPDTNRAGCYIITNDLTAWHLRLSDAGLPVSPVEEEPWGMREFTLTDPSGNRLRFGQPSGDQSESD